MHRKQATWYSRFGLQGTTYSVSRIGLWHPPQALATKKIKRKIFEFLYLNFSASKSLFLMDVVGNVVVGKVVS